MEIDKINNVFDWKILADSYLFSALICCDSVLEELKKLEDEKLHLNSYDKKYFGFNFAPGNLIRPIVFNFKHGAELYIKGLGNLWDVKIDAKHDLEFLKDVLCSKKEIDIGDLWYDLQKYYFGSYINQEENVGADKKNEAERYPFSKRNNCYRIPYIISAPEFEKDMEVKYLVVDSSLVERIKDDILSALNTFRRLYKEGFLKN